MIVEQPRLPGFEPPLVHPEPASDTIRIAFFVPGIPKPGGSKRAIPLMRNGRPICRPGGVPIVNVVDDSANKDWKQAVAVFARQAYQGPPLTGPLKIQCEFIMPRLKGHYGSGRNAGALKDSAPHAPTVKPDATKLFRSTEDALTGVLWMDDAQIVLQVISKKYGEQPGARIVLARA